MRRENVARVEETGVPEPPRGWRRLVWLGPGFLWMVSATGSGEMLFTPRVAAFYGYSLLWALLAAIALKWFINREVGRFSVCTGATILEGFKQLPGPKNWALWLILAPQLFVAVSTVAGLAGAAATALVLVLPGGVQLWMILSTVASAALILRGHYRGIEKLATVLGIGLALAALAAAASVFPGAGPIAAGLVPQIPAEIDYAEILPWLGFMLSGAAGLMWYSYWIRAKGYGAAELNRSGGRLIDPANLSGKERDRLRGWISQMTIDTTAAVLGASLIAIAFLILGAELLKPKGLAPEENRIAEVLGRLLGEVWGPVGFWFMIVSVFVGFWSAAISVQDGFGRLFANGTRLLLGPVLPRSRWLSDRFLHRAYVVVLTTLLPIALYLAVGEPVRLLKMAGAVEAAHIPVVAGLTLYVNHRLLPADLRASRPVFAATVLAGLFFALFAIVYLFKLISKG